MNRNYIYLCYNQNRIQYESFVSYPLKKESDLFKGTLLCLLLLAIIAWAANPRACCPRTDNVQTRMSTCSMSILNPQPSNEDSQDSNCVAAIPVTIIHSSNEPMPRGELNDSETMPSYLSYAPIANSSVATSNELSKPFLIPEAISLDPPKTPPRFC